MLLAITLLSAATCSAQEVKLVEKLADGSFVVSIDGVEHRAFGPEKMRELEKRKIDFDAAQAINAEQNKTITAQAQEISLLKKDVEIVGLQRDSFKKDFEQSRLDAARNWGLFMTERELRQEASNFIPKGQSHGFWGKVLDGLNSQAGQSLFKLVIPTAQAVRVFTRCN